MVFYIWKELFKPLLNCTVGKPNYLASTHLFMWHWCLLSFKWIISSQCLALATIRSIQESIMSYHKTKREAYILGLDTEDREVPFHLRT